MARHFLVRPAFGMLSHIFSLAPLRLCVRRREPKTDQYGLARSSGLMTPFRTLNTELPSFFHFFNCNESAPASRRIRPMGVTTRKNRMDKMTLETIFPMKWESPNQKKARGRKTLGQAMVRTNRTMATGTK